MASYIPQTSIQDEVISFLLTSPNAQAILGFQASENAQQRLLYLLEANRDGTLTPSERAELEEASHMNHLMMLLKAKAAQMAK